MALKWLFFLEKKIKKLLNGRGICPQAHVYDMLEFHHFANLATPLRHFSNEKISTFGLSPPPFSKILVARLFTGVPESRNVDLQNRLVCFLKDQLCLSF